MDSATYQRYTTFVNYYIHQVNLMRHLLGESYWVTYADLLVCSWPVRARAAQPVPSRCRPIRTTIDWQESALVCFERGYVKLASLPLAANRTGRLELFRDPGNGAIPETRVPQLPWIHAMRQQAMNFVAAVKGERKPPCEATEALEDLRVARAYIRLLTGI